MLNHVDRFLHEEDGATMVEYGMMVALITVVCIVVITALGQHIGLTFDRTNTTIVEAGPNVVPVTDPPPAP